MDGRISIQGGVGADNYKDFGVTKRGFASLDFRWRGVQKRCAQRSCYYREFNVMRINRCVFYSNSDCASRHKIESGIDSDDSIRQR
jgi:hypothetical protein